MNNELPLCTIMIPTFNQEKYLKYAIASALDQDYSNLEVIVADDASTDRTKEFLSSIKDPRLCWHTNTANLGRVANYRDLLVHHAQGEWVVNLDGDDFFIDPTFISSAIRAVQSNPDTVIVFADRYEYQDPVPNINRERRAETARPEPMQGMEYILSWPKTKIRIHHLTALYNRSKALETGFYTKNIISSDYDSLFRLMAHGMVIHIPAKVAVWRYHTLNASVNKSVEQKIDDLLWMENVCEYISGTHPEQGLSMKRWLRRNVAHRYYGFLLSSIRNGNRTVIKTIDKELDNRYPGLRFSVLLCPSVWLKLMFHVLRKVFR